MPDPGIVSPPRSSPGIVGAPISQPTPSNAIKSNTVSRIVVLTRAEYDALGVWPSSTMYLVVP